ncbi:hypothetical protein [Pseudohongiella acticola]|nr:hypothetical protein [Pseudohongiella acticola]
MTEMLARKRVKVDGFEKGKPKPLSQIRSEINTKVERMMAGTRTEQLSTVYGVTSCAFQFAELACRQGGVRIEVRRRVADGEPVFDKKKKAYVQRYTWEQVKAFAPAGKQHADCA